LVIETLIKFEFANNNVFLYFPFKNESVVVRTLTGHRSSCTSVEFHPFGEFFASGSADTDLKIWDIRKKGCIHTYTGHTRAIRNIKFTPDGRWVVTGGEDNVVKVLNLVYGAFMHLLFYCVCSCQQLYFIFIANHGYEKCSYICK
jgi:WD40 repeat protein